MPRYNMDGRTFNTAQELYDYQRQSGNTPPAATEESWSAFDPDVAGKIGVSEDQWNANVEQIRAMREGQGEPIPVGPQGSHSNNVALTPESTPQELYEGLRGMAYKQANPDAYPNPVNTQREFVKNIAKTTALLMGGAAAGGAFSGGKVAAAGTASNAKAGAAKEALTGVQTSGTLPINNAIPFTNGPAASSFGTGAVTSAAAKGGLLSRAGNFFRNNKDIIGYAAEGLGNAFSADAEADAKLDLLNEQNAITARNYGAANPGRAYRGLAPRTAPAPTPRFEEFGSYMYKYVLGEGIVKVPNDR